MKYQLIVDQRSKERYLEEITLGKEGNDVCAYLTKMKEKCKESTRSVRKTSYLTTKGGLLSPLNNLSRPGVPTSLRTLNINKANGSRNLARSTQVNSTLTWLPCKRIIRPRANGTRTMSPASNPLLPWLQRLQTSELKTSQTRATIMAIPREAEEIVTPNFPHGV